jgi:hypothetical protein
MIAMPCSASELIDKVTILRLKAQRIADAGKLDNIRRDLALLNGLTKSKDLAGAEIERLADRLAGVNARLWAIEDALRACERQKDFGPRFVALAPSVYANNDERAALKAAINRLCNSALVGEKSYA